MRSRLAAFALGAATALGCAEPTRSPAGGNEPEPPGPSPTATAAPPPLRCDLPPVDPALPPDCTRMGDLASIRQMSHPGGAIEADLRLEDGCGRTLPRKYSACLEAAGAALSPRDYEGATTLLLVAPPSSAEEEAALPGAIDAFLGARPPGERIAVHRWDAALAQIADFSSDHARLASQLSAGLGASAGAPADAATALEEARALVMQVNGVSTLERRAVVVLAPERAAPPLLTQAAPVLWVDAPAAGLTEAARDAATALDVVDAAGVVGLGTCDSPDVLLSAPEGPLEHTPIPLIAPLPETTAGTCDAGAAAAGVRAPLRRVALSFSEAERATYLSRDASGSREDFLLSVQLGDDVGPAPAKAHFRGKGSFDCSRRSYDVDLEGNRPRQLMPGLASDEFLLLAMCVDNAYSDQVTANQVAAKLGLMPYRSRVVELVLDGESRGVYLLMGKPKEQLLVQHARPAALLRRNNEAHGKKPEVKFAAPGVDPLATYEALLVDAESRSGADLLDTLERGVDLDQFLRWVALNSLLGSGDWVDEVWFLATEARPAPNRAFFSISAWDMDDLYAECHFSGVDAMVDPRGLSYCVEGRLERRILGDPAGYDRYVRVLSEVLTEITPGELRAALDQTAAELLPYFADPAVRAASEEIGRPATQAQAEAIIREELARLETRFAARHAALLHGVDVYRSP